MAEMLPPRDENDVEPCLQKTTLVVFQGGREPFQNSNEYPRRGLTKILGRRIMVFRDGQILLTSSSLQQRI